jgi:hypothetical protein
LHATLDGTKFRILKEDCFLETHDLKLSDEHEGGFYAAIYAGRYILLLLLHQI